MKIRLQFVRGVWPASGATILKGGTLRMYWEDCGHCAIESAASDS